MTEHVAPDEGGTPADPDNWRRLHPLSPLLRGGLFVLVIIGIIIANMRDRLIGLFVSDDFTEGSRDVGDLVTYLAAQGLLILFVILIFAAIALIVFFSWLAWRFRTFRVTDEAVEERSGIVFRQHRRAPLERIQSVNLQRPLLARIFGLTEVDVQTAGQGGKVALRYLSHAHAKGLRGQILRVRAITQDAHGATDSHPTTLPAAGAASQTANPLTAEAAAQFANGATSEAPQGGTSSIFPSAEPGSLQAQIDERAREFVDFDIDTDAAPPESLVKVPVGRLLGSILLSWDLLIPFALAVTGLVAGFAWHSGALALVVPAVLMFAGIGFGQFNRGFGFTLSRTADGVRIGSGLTATNTETLPLRRIHAIEARQPLGWRPFGWWKVRITTAGHSVSQGGQNRMQNVVLPVGLEADVLRVFEAMHFSAADSPELLSDALVGSGRGYLGAGPRAGWVLWFGRRRAGLWLDGEGGETVPESLRIRRGALTRSLVMMPIVRAQSIQLYRPLVHRMLDLATIQAHTVLGPVSMQMRGVELGQAREVFDRLAATVVRVQAAEHSSEVERSSEVEPRDEVNRGRTS